MGCIRVQQVLVLTLVFVVSSVIGCSTLREPTNYEKGDSCVGGIVHFGYRTHWNYGLKGPALAFGWGSDYRIRYGDIINLSADTVRFDENRRGPFFDPEPTSYALSAVTAVINSEGQLVYGRLPDHSEEGFAMRWVVQKADREVGIVYDMLFVSDDPVAYCMEHGRWQVKKVHLVSRSQWAFESLGEPLFYFNIEQNTLNDLGQVTLNEQSDKPYEGTELYIPAKVMSSPSDLIWQSFVGSLYTFPVALERLFSTEVDYVHTIRRTIESDTLTHFGFPVEHVEVIQADSLIGSSSE